MGKLTRWRTKDLIMKMLLTVLMAEVMSGRSKFHPLFVAAALVWFALPCSGALIFNPGDTTKSENFDGLGTSGAAFPVAGVPFVAWDTDVTDAVIITMTTDTGSGTGGGVRNVGVAGVNALTDRALGSLGSGSVIPAFGLNIQNNTGGAIGGFTISYRSEHWRSGDNAGTEVWNFQYAIVSSEISMDTSAATWIDLDALDMTELNPTLIVAAARDGNASGNFATVSGSLAVTLNAGEFIAFRWLDANSAGADAIMAVDDFTITAVPEPTTWAGLIFGAIFCGTQVVRRLRNRQAAQNS